MAEKIAACREKPPVAMVSDSRAALKHARAAVVSSGTATVEAALAGCPCIAVYRLSPLSYAAARKLVKVPFAAMPNLIAGEQVVPELLQNDFTPEDVSRHLVAMVDDSHAREKTLAGLARVRSALAARSDGQTAVERAAEAILATIPASVAS